MPLGNPFCLLHTWTNKKKTEIIKKKRKKRKGNVIFCSYFNHFCWARGGTGLPCQRPSKHLTKRNSNNNNNNKVWGPQNRMGWPSGCGIMGACVRVCVCARAVCVHTREKGKVWSNSSPPPSLKLAAPHS